MFIQTKKLNQYTLDSIWSPETHATCDESFATGETFTEMLNNYIIPVLENANAHRCLTFPFTVIQELEKAAMRRDSLVLSFGARQRLVVLSDLLDKRLIYVSGKPYETPAARVILKTVKHLSSKAIIVFTEDEKLIDALKSTYASMDKVQKHPLHLIKTGSKIIESLYENEPSQ